MSAPTDNSQQPHVTCVMVTLPVPERLAYAKRSIDDYCRQSLAKKDLILVINGGVECVHRALHEYVASLGREDIRIFVQPPEWNLGQLRNFCLEVATGDILCQWDDDDLYHPERLERQLALLLEGGFEAVYLQEVMQFFPSENMLYWANWRATDYAGHPGTLMIRRGIPIQYPTRGDHARLGEDSEVARALIARGSVGYLAGMPHLFIYVSHGLNSWHAGHHQMLANELAISQALLRRREEQIRAGLAPHGFAPETVTLAGSNGVAFTL